MKILITGATGFVGRALGLRLAQEGHELVVLSRDPERARARLPFRCEAYDWQSEKCPPPARAYEGLGAIVHLAGESVAASRWTEAKKKEIRESRVLGTRNLVCGGSVPVLVAASAIGFYGERGDDPLTEGENAGGSFLAGVCRDWEAEVRAGLSEGRFKREVRLRTGLVLGQGGGALEKMLPVFKAGIGGPLGSGRQWMSWIHLDDLVSLYLRAIMDSKWSGAVNATAPEPETNREFTRALASELRKPSFMTVPKIGLRMALGEMSAAVLESQKVLPAQAQALGFEFRYPKLGSALHALLGPEREGDEVLRASQWVDRPVPEVFAYFSEPRNLESLTPPWLGFNIAGTPPAKMESGALIDYRLKVHGLPMKWRTRIEEWVSGERFVDTQLKGPYAKWHHTHRFRALQGGTLLEDEVRYRLPLGPLGRFAGGAFVRKDVEGIFEFRRKKIRELFVSNRGSP